MISNPFDKLSIHLTFIIILSSTMGLKPGKSLAQAENDSTIMYINSMEYAFMMHEETRWMIKAGMIVKNEYVNQNPFKISFEHRIKNSFTATASIDHSNMVLPENDLYLLPLNFSLETRWYYRMNKRIKEGKAASSLSDNYLAIGGAYTWILNNQHLESMIDRQYYSLYAKWGMQRRYLKYGHIDIGIKAGMMDGVGNGFTPSLVFNTYVEMGLGFSKDKQAIDREKLCPFLRCYEADRFIIKANLSNLLNIGAFNDYKWVAFSPQVELEQKLGSSPFSLNAWAGITLSYFEFTSADEGYIDRSWIVGATLEGRYYYNLKKSIRTGRSGNGLSANYVAAGGGYHFVNGQNDYMNTETGPQLYLATGWQRLLNRHLYFDIQVGANYYFEPNQMGNLFDPRLKFGLGYRF